MQQRSAAQVHIALLALAVVLLTGLWYAVPRAAPVAAAAPSSDTAAEALARRLDDTLHRLEAVTAALGRQVQDPAAKATQVKPPNWAAIEAWLAKRGEHEEGSEQAVAMDREFLLMPADLLAGRFGHPTEIGVLDSGVEAWIYENDKTYLRVDLHLGRVVRVHS